MRIVHMVIRCFGLDVLLEFSGVVNRFQETEFI